MSHAVDYSQRQSFEEVLDYGLALANQDRFLEYTEEFVTDGNNISDRDAYMAATLGILMENTERYMQRYDETTRSTALANYDKYVFPIIRAVIPNLAAPDLVSLQPMTGPQSFIFYLDYVYGTKKGRVSPGDRVFETVDPNYGHENIEGEILGTGNASWTRLQGTLSWAPVRPGTVTIHDGTQIVTDDGAGNLIGDVGTGNNNIDYANGSFDVTFDSAPASEAAIEANYEYSAEGNKNVPELDLIITSVPVIARRVALRLRWTLETAINLANTHGLSAASELAGAAAAEIKFEIDQKVTRDLESLALQGSNYGIDPWYKFPGEGGVRATGIAYKDHQPTIIDKFQSVTNRIEKESGRATGNWIVMGTRVGNVVQTLPQFVAEPYTPGKGVRKIGTLAGQWTCYRDSEMPELKYMVGYKGSQITNAGYILAMYVPAMVTPDITLDDFVTRKGMMSLYAKKSVNKKFYMTGEIVEGVEP